MESYVKNRKQFAVNQHAPRKTVSGWGFALAVAVAASLYGTTAFTSVHAQSTTGAIFGQAPAGGTVTVRSSTGLHRHMTVKGSGHYKLAALPLGIYTATLAKDGKVVDTRPNINLSVGGGAEVDFACPQDQCAESPSAN